MEILELYTPEIYSEKGVTLRITTLEKLPRLTPGLLEVNVVKPLQMKIRGGAEAKTLILLYLYFMRDVQGSREFSEEISDHIHATCPMLMRIVDHYLASGRDDAHDVEVEMCRRMHEHLLKLDPAPTEYLALAWDKFSNAVLDLIKENNMQNSTKIVLHHCLSLLYILENVFVHNE